MAGVVGFTVGLVVVPGYRCASCGGTARGGLRGEIFVKEFGFFCVDHACSEQNNTGEDFEGD